jgi:hypothetical protein
MQLKSIVRCAQALAIAIGASVVMSPLGTASAAALTYEFLIFEVTFTVCNEVRPGVEVCQNLAM